MRLARQENKCRYSDDIGVAVKQDAGSVMDKNKHYEYYGCPNFESADMSEDKNQQNSKLHCRDYRCHLMKSAHLNPPDFLVPKETNVFNPTIHDVPSDDMWKQIFTNDTPNKNMLASLSGLDEVDNQPSCSFYGTSSNQMNTYDKNNVEEDIYLSSSENDPFETDEDSDYEEDSEIEDDSVQNLPIRKQKRKCIKRFTQKEKTRKRTRNVTTWKRNEIKLARNSGKEYLDWKGNTHSARKLKDPCKNCKKKCVERIGHTEREEIFKDYWSLADINRQRDFIARHVVVKVKGRTRLRKQSLNSDDSDEPPIMQERSRRTFTNFYYLTVREERISVCQIFFLNTLCISAQVVKTVIKKLGSTGVISADKRGKVCKNSQIDDTVKQTVRNHINSFDFIESHYCRINTSRLYLPPTLNISKMYVLYEEYCNDNNIKDTATESMYRTIFVEEFNISFFKPKKDLCDICHAYENSSEEEKLKIEEEYRLHRENRLKARESKDRDKKKATESSSFVAAAFNLQKALPVPKSEVGLAYYKLKLQTYNFSIYNLANNNGVCFMWYECIAKRGSCEIGSCLILFVKEHVQKGVKEFSFFSDNCSGQNRNKYLFSLYNYLTQKYQITIRHQFMERGHTQTEGDSMHSVIEKAARHILIIPLNNGTR
ncbi:unnamed protein product [Acanthoscelides obtectus]|uniref:DUF7869 domain-containing protein n=1 Tax=Acanthoscelides obtectus TaxID=200917 RepID=A0A9P0KC43_ACAOB|nr:unnamed protein product [Acanthoscelides obtectus]CAK1666390.1 hypothetical protein AOBTE_LOCUS25296 [Acanthoscelides obtectus]